ncbi:MAG: membrane dipeptidase [Oscillospiraceae bacterium]
MRLFDLHCDTITECLDKGKSLVTNDLQLDLERGNQLGTWVQVFACWLDTKYVKEDAYNRFLQQRALLLHEIDNHPNQIGLYHTGTQVTQHKCLAILSVEGGHVLGGKLEHIQDLKELGVSFLTLVWNGDNEIGCGAKGSDRGLTSFGREAVAELENRNIIIDISHLNEKGTEDVFGLVKKPLVATHSNSRLIHDNKRNLYDEQIRYLIANDGLCGFNYYPVFVNGKEDCTIDEFKRHLDHILSIGGEDILSLGSDFDGASMPSFLKGIDSLYIFYGNVLKWYGEKVADKLFYENAKRFVDENIIV